VAGNARQASAIRPPAITIHYDGDVRRQSFGVDRESQLQIRIPWPERFQQIFHEVKPLCYTALEKPCYIEN
jgi:hypothetical protein